MPGRRVPILDLERQYAPLREELLNAIAGVCDSQQFILGKEAEKLEKEIADFLNGGSVAPANVTAVNAPAINAAKRSTAATAESVHRKETPVEAVGCSSGTDALWLALLAAGIQPGDSVITTPFSFFATASSIVRLRARPVFIDIEDGTLNLDPALVRAQAVRVPKLSAIMPVHLYGQCAEMDSFSDIASELKIAIVEDSAQAFGAT